MQRSVQSATIDPRRYALSEQRGGTGAMVGAQGGKNLNLVTSDMLNAAGGVAGLDASSKLNNSIFPTGTGTRRGNLQGPLTLVQSSSSDFKITDYDSAKTYALSMSSGTVSQVGDTVTITAPSATGNVTLTMNGQQYVLAVVAPHPARPTITSPVAGSIQRSKSVYVTGSAYASVGTPLAQQAAHWQVASDPLFATIVAESANDTVNLASWVFNLPNPGQSYYIRVRYQNTNSQYSDWSPGVSILSSTEFYGQREEAKLTTTDSSANGAFGYSCAMNADGTVLVVGTQGVNVSGVSTAGAIYIFKRTGTSWSLFQRITAPTPTAVNRFGIVVAIDATATRIVSQEYMADTSGKVYVYTYNGTTYALEQTILAPGGATPAGNFGIGPWISGDGTRMFLGERGFPYSPLTFVGRAHIYLRTGTTWALEQTIDCPVAARSNSLYFAGSFKSDYTGTRAILSCIGSTVSGIKQLSHAYIYLRTGTTWALEQELVYPAQNAGDLYGNVGTIDASGVYAAVSAANHAGSGVCLIFKRTGTVWTLMQTVTAGDQVAGSGFGQPIISADGSKLLIAASNGNFGNILSCGTAYLFTRNGETWTQVAKYVGSDTASGDVFANSYAAASDFSRIALGAPNNDNQGMINPGAMYIYS